MKNRGRIYLFGCVLLVSSLVSGYELLSPKRTWQTTPTYIVDDDGVASIGIGVDKGISATVNAINTGSWNGTEALTVVNAVAGSVVAFSLGDGIPMLSFTDPTGQCSGNCLAATFTGFYQTDGRGRNRKAHIWDADIVTNDSYNWTSVSEGSCSNEFYIEGVQVHEIGHGLGLGHSSVLGATMYPSVAACDNGPASIEDDDIAGLCALYGCDDGGGSGGGGSCSLGQIGDSCSANGECCSGKCRGRNGSKTCK
jgi:hypothetical protein